MKLDWNLVLIFSLTLNGIWTSNGCHNIETDQSEQTQTTEQTNGQNTSNYFADARVFRKKRSALHQDAKIVRFFPGCIKSELASSGEYASRLWDGPVSYAVYHSSWYEEVDDRTCIGENHTIECWIQRLPFFVSGLSPALIAAQKCVKEYNDVTSGTKTPPPRYPPGLYAVEGLSCPSVDEDEYENEFKDSVNETDNDFDDDSTISNFGEVINFAKNDMICLSCDCVDLDSDDDESSYDFEDGTDCGDCWSTRLAISVRPKSRLRKPVRRVAKNRAGLRKKPRKANSKTTSGNNQGKQNQNINQRSGTGQNSNTQNQNGANRSKGPVFVSPVNTNKDNKENTVRTSNEQRTRSVFVAPVGVSSSSDSRTDTSRQISQTQTSQGKQVDSKTVQSSQTRQSQQQPRRNQVGLPGRQQTENSQRQQTQRSQREQDDSRTVQPLKRQQARQQSSKQNSGQSRQQQSTASQRQKPAAQYVQPIRRENSPSGQSGLPQETKQQKSQTSKPNVRQEGKQETKSKKDNKKSPESSREQSRRPAQQRQQTDSQNNRQAEDKDKKRGNTSDGGKDSRRRERGSSNALPPIPVPANPRNIPEQNEAQLTPQNPGPNEQPPMPQELPWPFGGLLPPGMHGGSQTNQLPIPILGGQQMPPPPPGMHGGSQINPPPPPMSGGQQMPPPPPGMHGGSQINPPPPPMSGGQRMPPPPPGRRR